MCLMNNNLIYFIACFSVFFPLSRSLKNDNTLLLIMSFDGFRYDYFERNLTKTLVSLRVNSSYAHHMLSVFPSKTFPNHFSIATGLYAEVHGVLDNEIFDKSNNKTLKYGYDLFHYNECVVPLWTLNERAGGGRHSGCVMYPGCNFKYQDVLPSHYLEYNMSVPWHHRVDIVLDWFQHPDTPINLGMAYFEQPDTVCHKFGPDSAEVNAEIARVDDTVAYLLRGVRDRGLADRLNIVLLSDHGAQAVLDPQHMIQLEHYADPSLYRRDGIPPNLQIFPNPGTEAQLLQAFRAARSEGANFTAYTQDEMPERWNYKNCARTPPVLVVADLGYLFTTDKKRNNSSPVIGNHGYDPLEPSMWAFFMALGPAFKQNFTVEPFENIHIYPLAAHLLGLQQPELRPNGSLAPLQDILVVPLSRKEEVDAKTYYVGGFILVSIVLILVVTFFGAAKNLCQKDKSKISNAAATYKVLEQGPDEEHFFNLRETLSSDCDEDSPT